MSWSGRLIGSTNTWRSERPDQTAGRARDDETKRGVGRRGFPLLPALTQDTLSTFYKHCELERFFASTVF